MSPSKPFRVAGAAALVIGSVAVFVQYLVTPLSSDLKAADIVDKAARHHDALGWALALDVPAILVIPAVLFVGYLAGSRTSTFAGIATALCLVPAIGAVVLFANDAVVYEAATLSDRASAVAMVDGYENNAMIGGITVFYLLTHLVGFVMLGFALRRTAAVPIWAAAAVGVWPILEMVGYAAVAKPVALVGYGLLVIGYVACAAALIRRDQPVQAMSAEVGVGQNRPA
jgi:hypothetical protein